MRPCGLQSRRCSGLDLLDKLPFEGGFEFASLFSHIVGSDPRALQGSSVPQNSHTQHRLSRQSSPINDPGAKFFGGRESIVENVEKPRKNARLFHIFHNAAAALDLTLLSGNQSRSDSPNLSEKLSKGRGAVKFYTEVCTRTIRGQSLRVDSAYEPRFSRITVER